MRKKLLLGLLIMLLPISVYSIARGGIIDTLSDEAVDNSENLLIDSPLFTGPEDEREYNQPSYDMKKDGFSKRLENNNLELYDNKYGGLRILNKKTNYLWTTDILNINDYEFNNLQKRRIKSSVEYVYRDSKNKIKSETTADNGVKLTSTVEGNSISYLVNSTKGQISFKYTIILNDDGIDISLKHEDIKEEGESVLTSLTFFKYLGATYKDTIPGYALIPSGNGGLIRFNKLPSINSSYKAPYYGSDMNRSNIEEDVFSVPFFGITHRAKRDAISRRILNGATFASFNYSPSSIDRGFNMLYNTFNIREPYLMNIPGAKPILMVPEDFYKVDINEKITILSNNDADYIGMAKSYRNDLINEGKLEKTSSKVSAHIDVLGGETKDGIIFDEFIKMTTTKDIVRINEELKNKFNNEFIYTLRGFNNKGYSYQTYDNFSFNSKLGSLKDLKDINYSIYYNPSESYRNKPKALGGTLVNLFNKHSMLEVEENKKYKFYTDMDHIIKGLAKAGEKYSSLSIDGVGYRLYGDKNNKLNRIDSMNKIIEAFSEKENLYRPNEYLFSSCKNYFNMPIYHDRIRIITDSVPFLQILLRGYIPYYSSYLNFSTNGRIDLLKCIDYGSNPSYLITNEESHKLSSTMSSHLYATSYESNKELIFSQIEDINKALGSVNGEEIVDRVVIDYGVVMVKYSNNVCIYINYTNKDYLYNDINIKNMSYRVVM